MRRQRGQSTTEYMLAVAVIVVAVVAAALPFHEYLSGGMREFNDKFTTYYAEDDERSPRR